MSGWTYAAPGVCGGVPVVAQRVHEAGIVQVAEHGDRREATHVALRDVRARDERVGACDVARDEVLLGEAAATYVEQSGVCAREDERRACVVCAGGALEERRGVRRLRECAARTETRRALSLRASAHAQSGAFGSGATAARPSSRARTSAAVRAARSSAVLRECGAGWGHVQAHEAREGRVERAPRGSGAVAAEDVVRGVREERGEVLAGVRRVGGGARRGLEQRRGGERRGHGGLSQRRGRWCEAAARRGGRCSSACRGGRCLGC